jgi:hypothetical protein
MMNKKPTQAVTCVSIRKRKSSIANMNHNPMPNRPAESNHSIHRRSTAIPNPDANPSNPETKKQ